MITIVRAEYWPRRSPPTFVWTDRHNNKWILPKVRHPWWWLGFVWNLNNLPEFSAQKMCHKSARFLRIDTENSVRLAYEISDSQASRYFLHKYGTIPQYLAAVNRGDAIKDFIPENVVSAFPE